MKKSIRSCSNCRQASVLVNDQRGLSPNGAHRKHFDLQSVRETGVSATLLRVMLMEGLVEHRPNIMGPKFTAGCIIPAEFFSGFKAHSAFVLTSKGLAFVKKISSLGTKVGCKAKEPAIPTYCVSTGELWFRSRLVKRFRRRAPNQQYLLECFQEIQWKERMDDPLPRSSVLTYGAKRPGAEDRLRDTVKNLNRGKIGRHLRFDVEPDGHGVRWRAILKK